MRFTTLIAFATAVTIERLYPAWIKNPRRVERPKDVYEIDDEERYGKKKLEEKVKKIMYEKNTATRAISWINQVLPFYSDRKLARDLARIKETRANIYRYYWRLLDAVAAKLPLVSKAGESTDTPRPKDISKITRRGKYNVRALKNKERKWFR